MSKGQNPHDKVIKNILGRQETAVSFLQNFLPETITRHLELEGLSFEQTSHIPDHLQEYFSDILMRMPLRDRNQEAEVYVLLEHKSYLDEMIPLQLLRYMVETWSTYGHKTKKPFLKLPLILPIVIAHGEHKWRYKTKLSSIVDVPDESFLAYLPDFEYNLFDVNVENVRGYAFHSALKSLFAIWQISPKREFLDELKDALMLLFQGLEEKQLDRFLKILVHYLSLARPSEELPDIMDVIRTLPAGGETMETIADMLEQRGEERGISLGEQRGEQRGELKKCRDLLLRNINARFGTINRDIVERIKEIQSVEILDGLFDMSLRASSFDEFQEQVHRATDN
jgi:predicted transposase/invertase (TIGR01784 family)